MKKGILFLSIIISVQANAQSLKDALFGGKLKTDSNTVIRKGEDLSSKIDTSRRKPVEPEKNKLVVVIPDPSVKKLIAPNDSTASVPVKIDNNAALKDNTKIWKEFVDTVISVLNIEVMDSKKIKKGDYFVIVDYSIDTDGQVTINNVIPTPENKFLEEQVKERLSISTPRLNPVMGGNDKPRKVIKRYNFTISRK